MSIKSIINLHVMLFLTIICAFTILFDYPIPIIILSLFTVFCLYSLTIWTLTFYSLFFKSNSLFSSIFTCLILTISTCSILFIYTLNFVSNSNWGTNVTFDFVVRYSRQLSGLQNTLPIPLETLYLLLLLVIGSIFVFYFKNIKQIRKYISLLFVNLVSKGTSAKNRSYIISSLLVIPFFIFTYQNTQSNFSTDMWNGEPLTDLLLPHTTIILGQSKEEVPNNYQVERLEKNKDKPNIILIIADSLRPDHMGAYGYERPTTKFLDALLANKDAIKIENAFSTCAESNCGILSSLTSRPFEEINKGNISINKVLKDLGYDINFILSADHTWAGLKEHYPPYDLFYDSNLPNKQIVIDDQLVLNKLSEIPSYKKPAFFYFHLMSSHGSGHRNKTFSKFTPSKSPNDWFYRLPIVKNLFSTDTQTLEKNFYDNGVISTDYYISQIYKQLDQKGYLENSIVWIISDHGEALGEHGQYGHIKSLYNEEIKIPMIIVDKSKSSYKERSFASQLDIAPTILDRLGVNIPPEWKGVSLLQQKPEAYTTHHNIPDRTGVKAIIMKGKDNNLFKMIYQDNPLTIKGVYNLSTDKREKNNLNNKMNESLVKSLKEKIIKRNHQLAKAKP